MFREFTSPGLPVRFSESTQRPRLSGRMNVPPSEAVKVSVPDPKTSAPPNSRLLLERLKLSIAEPSAIQPLTRSGARYFRSSPELRPAWLK